VAQNDSGTIAPPHFSQSLGVPKNRLALQNLRAQKYQSNHREILMSESNNQLIFTKNEVVITDIKMPFWSMVGFMVKWAIAAIPAFVILAILGAVVIGVLRGLT
jgi:hypothetical protein